MGEKEYIENETTHTKPLMTPAQVRLMADDEMLIICKNKRPVKDKMMDLIVA
jgi:type IV secretory pathway TraG/TraD family ATPase VirD4